MLNNETPLNTVGLDDSGCPSLKAEIPVPPDLDNMQREVGTARVALLHAGRS